MQTFWLVMLVFAVGMFGVSMVVHVRYRRRREPLPWYYAGNSYGAAAMAFLVISQLLLPHDRRAAMSTLAVAMVLLAADIFHFFKARKPQS